MNTERGSGLIKQKELRYREIDIEKPDWIKKEFADKILSNDLRGRNLYIHSIDDRGYWDSINKGIAAIIEKQAGKRADTVWKSVPSMSYVNYFEGGNISAAEAGMKAKRTALLILFLAECIENKGKYLPQIVNGIMSICEESTWAAAAHFHACGKVTLVNQDEAERIPDYHGEPILDLRAVETACLLSAVLAAMQSRLDNISKNIARRIRDELCHRIITPYLERDGSWWLGFETDFNIWRMNNWNTHMNKHLIFCALAVCEERRMCERILLRAVQSLDIFLNLYPSDGACDEGAGYWSGAAGGLIDALELLDYAAETKGNIFKNQKIRDMAEFILNVRIAGNHYIGFADVSPVMYSDPWAIFRFGKLFADDRFYAEGAYLFKKLAEDKSLDWFGGIGLLFEAMRMLDDFGQIKDYNSPPFSPRLNKYYDYKQIMISRELPEHGKGFFLAAKGGHNHESHNHNDVGNYIVYLNSKPVIIDVGIGTYSKDLFTKKRYTLWATRSANHNVPIIDGLEQRHGDAYRARGVMHRAGENKDELYMDIIEAYPIGPNAAWKRKLSLSRLEQCVEISDDFSFDTAKKVEIVMLTPQKPDLLKEGFRLENCAVGVQSSFAISMEAKAIDFDDEKLIKCWGNRIWRIVISSSNPVSNGTVYFKIKADGDGVFSQRAEQ